MEPGLAPASLRALSRTTFVITSFVVMWADILGFSIPISNWLRGFSHEWPEGTANQSVSGQARAD